VTISPPEHAGWLEISIHIDPVTHESLCAFLFDLGCTGVITEDMQNRALKAYLPVPENLEHIQDHIDCFLQDLKGIFPELGDYRLAFNKIEDQDWSRNWRRFFRPDRVTPRLMVLPAWEPVPLSIDREIIRIDPGPAFGTGQHPTTRMCLEAMEKTHLTGSWRMLDVGTGSGILAIYGVKLGAYRVIAVDIDPEALRWANRNIALNKLSGAIELSPGPLEQLKGTFSLIAANLILGEILRLFSVLTRLLIPNGWLILSGILREQVNEIKGRVRANPFHESAILYQQEWACVILRKDHEK
jgi:ribosomal protein L11 methyltransferase